MGLARKLDLEVCMYYKFLKPKEMLTKLFQLP